MSVDEGTALALEVCGTGSLRGVIMDSPADNALGGAFADQNEPFELLISQIEELHSGIMDAWVKVRGEFASMDERKQASARNLVHYLGLRRHDIRGLQGDLARIGISSLGRSESHVVSNIDRVLRLLYTIVRRPYRAPEESRYALTIDEGSAILDERTRALLGEPPPHRKVRIMVTLPTDASTDYPLVRDLVASGMDCVRINGAHDSPEAWARMAANVKAAREETGKNCKICVDIPGPKLRTGHFAPGPQVIKWGPKHDALGRLVKPARIWLTAEDQPQPAPAAADAQFKLPQAFLSHLQLGSKIKFKDARGSPRSMLVADIAPGGVWLETNKTAYVVPGTRFSIRHTGLARAPFAVLGPLEPIEQYAFLRVGDTLILTRHHEPGVPELRAADGEVLRPARVSCTLPAIFDDVKTGDRVWFDDGKLGGFISSVKSDEFEVQITHASPAGSRLRGDRGINLPDTRLTLPALTDADHKVLRFAVRYADMIGHSFVRSADDVCDLQETLRRLGAEHLGIVLKIETRDAFENLPDLLLASLKGHSSAVMIARGDLAVESGFERMAEVQEEILWMCEAAHIPVIWATQVLEQLSKKGTCSRAEITDAAMSERAECVMLNKGPYVLEAVRTLDDILTRMQSHLDKKRSMMRPLKLAERFFSRELHQNQASTSKQYSEKDSPVLVV